MDDECICTKFKKGIIKFSGDDDEDLLCGFFNKKMSEIFYHVYKYSEMINSSLYPKIDKDKKVYFTAEFLYDPKTSQLEISDFIVERKE